MAGVRDNTVTNVASGGIASFKSVGQVPLKSLKVNFSPIQEGDGDPSPSNIRAISGWTGCNLWRMGKNLYGGGNADRTRYPLFLKKGTTVTVSIDNTDNRVNIIYYRKDASQIDYWTISDLTGTRKYKTFTLIEDAYYFSFADHNYVGNIIHNTMIELGSTISTYEPYNGTTVPVSWSDLGIVYGGWCNPITGEGKITHIIMSDTWGNWGTVADQGDGTELRYKKFPYPVKGNSSSNFNTCLCNVAPYNYNNQTGTTHFYVVGNSYNCRIYLPSGTDTNLQIQALGELVTPISFSFPPVEIKTLLGQNNIWSNANTIEAQYCALESLDIYKQRFKTNEPHLQNASGNITTFQTDMVAPLKECKVYFQPVQASGTPAPDNVLPITGWSELDVYKSGKNLFGVSVVNGDIYNTGKYAGFNSSRLITYNFVRIEAGTYTLSDAENFPVAIYAYADRDETTFISAESKVSWQTAPTTFTITTAKYVRFKWKNASGSVVTPTDLTQIQLEKGSTATTYETCSTIPIQFPSTYYGGWCNPLTGVGEIVYKYIHLTGNENWYVEENPSTISNASYLCSIRVEPTGQNSGVYKPAISDKLAPSTYWAPDLYCAVINTTSRVVIGLPQELSTKEAVNNWIQSIGGIDIVWESMFPTSFTFTPVNSIKTLKGQNNIWSNTNGITQVKYWTHGNIADKRKVVWNNMVNGYLSADDWKDRNTSETNTTFENGIATIDFYNSTGSYHCMVSKNSPTVYLSHKYYGRYECNTNKENEAMGFEMAGGRQFVVPSGIPSNTWVAQKCIVNGNRDGTGAMYIPFISTSTLKEGTIVKIRNVFYIDLTLMFGAGNEPTLEEFEALCVKNGIDLSQPYPYDEGTQMYWYF